MEQIVIALVAFGLYLLPTFVACGRDHRNAGPIFVVNLLLGWTLLGWVVALAWSLSTNVNDAACAGEPSSGP